MCYYDSIKKKNKGHTHPKGDSSREIVATLFYMQRREMDVLIFTRRVAAVNKNIKRTVVDEYAEACKKAGVSAAGQLTKMMKEFIEEVNNE